MRLSPGLSAILLAAAFLPITPSAAAADNAAVPSPLQQACDELARLIIPDIDDRAIDPVMTAAAQTFKKEESFQELERKYPGLQAAVLARLRPLLTSTAQRARPLYRAEISTLYARNLSLVDVRAAVAFWRGPGAVFRQSVQSNYSYQGIFADIAANENASEATVRSAARSAAAPAVDRLSPANKAQFGAFIASPAGRRMVALNPQKIAIDTKWINRSTPESERAIEDATTEAIVAHIAKTNPIVADRMRESLAAEKLASPPAE